MKTLKTSSNSTRSINESWNRESGDEGREGDRTKYIVLDLIHPFNDDRGSPTPTIAN